MTRTEILAILRFLEDTRTPGLQVLGVEARDPVWMMTIALLRRHYSNRRITISSLANSSGAAYTTALRHIEKMAQASLVRRSRTSLEPKLVYVEPTDMLLRNFQDYCLLLKSQMGVVFGLGNVDAPEFVFGAAHFAARIISKPGKISPPLGLRGPLRLLLKDEPTFLVLERMASEISVLLNTQVEATVLEYEDLNKQVIENSRADKSAFDLVALDIPWLGRMVMENALHDLDDELRRGNLNPFDFYAAAWESARCQGKQIGIPFAPTAELFLYRKDVFGSLGLEPPTTVDLVLDAARQTHRPAQGQYGIAWNAARGQPLGQTFIQIMSSFGSPPVNLHQHGAGFDLDTPWRDLRPSLDNEAGRATLEYLVELAQFSPPDISMMDWGARMDAYRTGRAVMCYEWSARTLHFEEDELSPARGKTGYLPHPSGDGRAGISPMGGWVLAIPSNIAAERRRPAWRVLQWLASPELTKCMIQNGSPSKFLHSVSSDPEVADLVPAFSVMDSMEKRGQLQIWPRPPIPFITSLMRIVGHEVHDAIWGDGDLKGVLARAENRLVPMFRDLGMQDNTLAS